MTTPRKRRLRKLAKYRAQNKPTPEPVAEVVAPVPVAAVPAPHVIKTPTKKVEKTAKHETVTKTKTKE